MSLYHYQSEGALVVSDCDDLQDAQASGRWIRMESSTAGVRQ